MESVCDMTQDFTDSAFTAHHHREQIIDLVEECRFQLADLLKAAGVGPQDQFAGGDTVDSIGQRIAKTVNDLRKQLQLVAMDQVGLRS